MSWLTLGWRGGGEGRELLSTRKTDWNSPGMPQTCQVLVSLPCPWIFPSFLTVPKADLRDRITGLERCVGAGWGRETVEGGDCSLSPSGKSLASARRW